MKTRFFSSLAVVFTVIFCALSMTKADAQCIYQLELTDSWGDGWNGSTIDVLVDGVTVLDDVTLSSGNSGTLDITVNTGQSITTLWNGGGIFDSEITYAILDPGGASVASDGPSPAIGSGVSVIASCPACLPPTVPIVFGVTESTADYTFTDNQGALEWEVSYGASGFTAGSGTEFISPSTNTGLSGLTAETTYDVYVRAICAVGDTSPWSGVSTFTTLRACPSGAICATYSSGQTPSDYGASQSTPSTCPSSVSITVPAGERLDSVSVYYAFVATGGAWMSEQSSWLECVETGQTSTVAFGSGSNAGTQNYARTGLNFAANATGTLTFELHAARSWGGSGCNTTYNYVESGWFLEAYTSAIPACLDITGLSAVAVTSSTANVSFTDPNTGSLGYIVTYSDGLTSDTINTASASAALSGLSASTTYSVSVQVLCSGGDTSAAVSTSFSTPCAPVAAPYSESFSSGSLPTCFSLSALAGGPWLFTGTPGYDAANNGRASGTYAWMDHSGTDDEVIMQMVDVDIAALTDPTLYFDHFSYYNGTVTPNNTLIVEAFDGTSWNNILPLSVNVADWQNYNVSLVGQEISGTSIVRLRFRAESGGSAADYNLDPLLDNIEIVNAITCSPISALASSNITSSSADFTWTDPNSASEWEVSYGSAGFTAGAGTESVVTAPSASLSGLSGNSSYDVYVRAICAPGDTSSWSSVSSFTTLCNTSSAPFSEPFDLTSTPSCWFNTGGESWAFQTASGTGASTYAATPGGTDHTGNGGAFAALDGSTPNPASTNLATLTSPQIDLSALTAPRLRFYVFSNNTTAPGDNATFYAIVDGTTDTLVSYSGDNANWVELTADLSAYAGQTIAIQIKADHNTMTGSQFYNDLLVDDFFIEETPSCFAPSALVFSNITFSSADVSWTDNNTPASSLFEVSIGAPGFTPGSGTETFVSVASESFTGLAEETTYVVYVRANCGVNSAWSSAGTFTTPPSCFAPTGAAIANVTDASADFSWADANNAPAPAGYQVSIGAAGFTAGSGTQTVVTGTSESFTGLAQETAYDVYVRSICAVGDTSAWTSVVSFTTLKTPPPVAQGVNCVSGGNSSIVFSESFETALSGWTGDYGTANGDWEVPDGSGSSGTGASDGYNGGNFMNYEASNTASNNGTIVSPAIDLSTGADDAELSFWMHAYGANMGTLNVGVGTSAAGPFTTEFTWSGQLQTSGTDAWVNVGVDLSAYLGQTIYVSFQQVDDQGGFAGDMCIDEMTVSTCVGCAAPSGLTASNVSADAADLAWTENGSATEWQVSYGAAGFTAGAGTESIVSSATASLGGLSAITGYDVYVRSICGAGDTSSWSAVASFTTLCANVAVPYTQDFSTFLPDACWNEAGSGTPATGPTGLGFGDWRSVGGEVRLNIYSSTDQEWVLTPNFDLGSGTAYQASFDFAIYTWQGTSPATCGSDDEFQFLISTDGGATWTSLYTADVTYGTTGLSNQIIDLSSYSGVVQFAFYGTDGAVNDAPDVDFVFDNFVIDTIPACQAVAGLTATATSSSTADVSFTDPNTGALGYLVIYGDGLTADTINSASATVSLSGLTANTSYSVSVAALCSTGDTSTVSTSFATPCAPFTAPYAETFSTSSTPTCWTNAGGESWIFSTGAGYGAGSAGDNTGDGGNYAWVDGSTSNPPSSNLATLTFSVDISALSTPRLRYYTFQNNTNAPGDNATLYVIVNGTDTADTYASDNAAWVERTVDLSSYSGVVSLAFKADHNGMTGSQFYADVLIDDVSIEETPSCFAVSALTATATSGTTADVSWTDPNGASEWEVSYGASGFAAGSGTESIVSSATASLSGLTAATDYDVYVRAICSAGDTSAWSSVASFTTACDVFSAPYSQDFETGSSALPVCWSQIDNNSDGDAWVNFNSSFYAQSGLYSASLYTDFNGGNNDDYLITPGFVVTGGQRLIYSYRVRSAGEPNDFEVVLSTTGTAPADFATTLVANASYSNTAYASDTIDLSAYSNDTVYVAWHVPAGGLDGWYIYIDDVIFEDIPACNTPTSVSFSNITATSADVTITDAQPTALEWRVSYGVGNTTDASQQFTSTTGQLTGLLPQTTYDVTVTTFCDGSNSVASSVYQFTTACGAQSVPYSTDFSTFLPDACWNEATGGNASTGPTTIGFGDWRASSGEARFNSYSSGSEEWILTPEFDLGTGSYQAEFDFGIYTWNGTTPATCGSDDSFDFLITTDGGATWTSLFSADGNYATSIGGDRQFSDLSAYSGVVQFAFFATDGVIDDPQDVDFTIDNFAINQLTTCYALSGIAVGVGFPTATQANIVFTDNNAVAAGNYVVEYGLSGFTLGTGTQLSGVSSGILISGLTGETSYDYYVRAICGPGDSSAWSSVDSFTTSRIPPAVAQGVNCVSGGNSSVVFSESFETALSGWTGDYGTGNGNWEVPDGATSSNTGASDGYNGGNFMNYEASNTADNNGTIVSPAIDLSIGSDDAELSFWMHAYGADMGTLNVGVGTDAAGPFTTEFTWSGQYQEAGGSPWINVGVDLSAYVGDTIYIAFTQYDTVTGHQYAGDMCIDEMTVTTCVACAAPSGLTASNVSADAADLSWTENGSATEWQVSYGAAGFTAGAGTESIVSSATASLGGLSAITGYDVYVRSICGAGDTSSWSAVASFTTLCANVAVPYTQDFSTFLPDACWNEAGSGTPATGPTGLGFGDWRSVGGEVRLNIYSSTDQEWVLTPNFDLGSGTAYQASFDFAIYTWQGTSPATCGSDDEFQFLISTDGGATWTSLYTADVTYGTTGLSNQIIDLSSYSGVVQFAFYGTDGAVNDAPDVDFVFDNFVIDTIPACQAVAGLTATATSSSTADVSFTDPNTGALGYLVIYGDGLTADTINSASATVSLSGLTANTSYSVSVAALCSTGDTSTVSTSFATPCAPFTAPYAETFSTSSTPTCWTNAGGESWIFSTGAGYGAGSAGDNTGDGGNYAWVDGSTSNPPSSNLATLTFSVDISALSTPRLRYYTFQNNTNAPGDNATLYVIVNGTDTADTYASDNAAWVERTVDLSSYSGVVSLAFKADHNGMTGSQFYADVLIDDVSIEETPSCFAVSALTATATSGTTADVSWTDPNGASEWEVSYGASGFAAGSGTESIVSSATASLSGLASETDYDVYVRAICSAGDTSAWSSVASFTTPCAAIVPAYSTDFSTFLPSSCWDEATSGTPATGPTSLGSGNWGADGFGNVGFSGAARINLYGSFISDWLITPSFDLSSGGPWEANFDVGVFGWNSSSASSLDSDDVFGLYASADGGATWTAIWSADDTYVTAAAGNNETVDLSTFTGTVQFAFYASSTGGSADNDLFVDNFAIRLANTNFTWSGATDNDWANNANWANGTAPSAATDVVIVPSATNQPVIAASQAVGELTVADNVTVTISAGGDLEVNGNLNLGAGSSFIGDGSVDLAGANGGTDLVINGSSTIENLEVSSNYSLTAGILNITGGLFLNGGDFTGGVNVVLISDANGTAHLDDFSGAGGTYNGQITCQLYVPGTTGIQHLISSPVSTPNLSELADDLSGYGAGLTGTDGVAVTPTATCDPTALDPSSNYGNMFEWSASTAQNIACPQQGGWIVRSAGDMDNARGYSAYLTGAGATLDMSGTPNSGDVTINMAALAITNNTSMSNWDILGNPYPSGLDRNALISGNQIPAPGSPSGSFGLNSISYWNPSGTYSGTYAPYLPGDVIASFQGFSANWDAGGTNPTITFSNSMRSTATGTWRTGWYNERIDVELRGNGFADRTIILFADDATNGFDAMYDAEKFASASGQPTLYTGSTEHYALNSLAADAYGQSIPMGVIAGADGYFEFDFSTVENLPNGSMLYLEDLATGTWTNVSENPVYGFNMLATDASDRFILHFTPEVTATAVDGTCENADAYIELTFDGYQIAGQDVAWNYAVSKEGLAQAQGSMVSTIAIPVSESGIYNVDFTFGNATVNEVLSINVPVAPTAAIPAEVALSENEAITLNGMFTNANSYEWAVDGVVFSTEANPTWTASTEGIYNIEVTVRSEDGCSASDNMVAEVSKSVTSINDVNAVFQITQDAYSVVVLTDAEGFMIEMIAMDGKLVASARASQGANVLSTQALAAGVYEVRLSSANGVVGSQKVLVK